MGAESCLRKTRDILLWPQMSHDIKNYVSLCDVCNGIAAEFDKRTYDVPQHTERVDVFTLYNRDCFVLVDFFSDCWDLDELNSANSTDIIHIYKRHFARYGIPDELISDNAAVFTGSEFVIFARTWEFCYTTSSPYCSRSNGKAESAVKIAKQLLTKCMSQKEDPWKAILDWRNTPNERLGTSPAQHLMLQRTQKMLPAEKNTAKT